MLSKVFISYSHKDVAWKERVLKHLKVLETAGEFTVWDDQRINSGDEWLPEITAAMSSAEVAVLLVSADFLTSGFIRSTEVPRLLERRLVEGLRGIPVFVEPCAWKAVGWLAGLQGRPRNGKTLSELRKHDAEKELASLALEIRELIERESLERPTLKRQMEVFPHPAVVLTDKRDRTVTIQDSNESRESIQSKGRELKRPVGRIWMTVWSRTAPMPIVLGIQWILGVFILHATSPPFGGLVGTLSPFWLLAISYAVVRFITHESTEARIVGGMLGGIAGAAIGRIVADWGTTDGLAFGAFFGCLLTGYWSDTTKQIRVVWAFVSTALLLTCLGVFKDLEFFLLPNGYAFIGTGVAIVFWACIAACAKNYRAGHNARKRKREGREG